MYSAWTFPFTAYMLVFFFRVCIYKFPGSGLSTAEQIDMQFYWEKCKKQVSIAVPYECTLASNQHVFRKMIVNSDAINQRRKRIHDIWIRVCQNVCETSNRTKTNALLQICWLHHNIKKFSIVGRITAQTSHQFSAVVVLFLLPNYGNTNWIFMSEFHVFHWTACWLMF